jgi:hypothetical protein
MNGCQDKLEADFNAAIAEISAKKAEIRTVIFITIIISSDIFPSTFPHEDMTKFSCF